MHILFIHQAFPAQFGRLALELTKRYGWHCSFLIEAVADCPTPSAEMLQRLALHFVTLSPEFRSRSEAMRWHESYGHSLEWCQAVFDAVRSRPNLRPDLVVSYGPVGTPTVFLPEILDCPLINYCEYYYGGDRDVSYRIDLRPVDFVSLFPRCSNAINLVSLLACAGGNAPTHWQRQTFPERFHSRIEVHFDGIDTELYQPRPSATVSLPAGARLVTFVTRGLESMRGFDLFMRVAGRIQRERSDVYFLVVGNDKSYYGCDSQHTGQPSFKQWVLSQGDYDLSRFVFLGHVEPERLADILRRSDLHISLTVPFVLSWSLLNALSCGCVVLASDVAPVREVIAPGKNGLVEALFDIDGLAETALQVLADPAAYRPLGQAGRELMLEKYSVDVAIPELKNYFERMATKGVP